MGIRGGNGPGQRARATEGIWIHWGQWLGGNRSETAGMGACIHRVRNILFRMEATLVGGNRTAHLCGCVDPLMIVSQVLKGGGTCRHLCARPMANDPYPPETESTHTPLNPMPQVPTRQRLPIGNSFPTYSGISPLGIPNLCRIGQAIARVAGAQIIGS